MPGLHNLFNTLTKYHAKRDDHGNTPLYKAAKEGSLSKVKSLLKAGADPNAMNEHHLTPLHQAAYWGETEIVELLLQYGAKVNADNGKGWTPLHSAAVAGGLKARKKVIEILLGNGADAKKPDKHGWSAEDYMALWEANVEAAEKLKKYMEMLEGFISSNSKQPPAPRPPGKPPGIHTPKH